MYFVVEISAGDSKIAGKAIYEYESSTEAIAAWHKKLGTAMSSELYTSDLVMVVDQYGTVMKKEYYQKAVEVEETAEV